MTHPNYPVYYRNANSNGNGFDDRGALLPFLAGVLVTTPFIFAAKNQNQNPPYPYYPPQQPPVYYPMYPPSGYPMYR